MDNPVVINAIIAALTAVILAVLAKLFGRKDTSYDQIQEDMKEMRGDIKVLREEVYYQGQVIRHLDDEVIELRGQVQRNEVPPLPQRKPWPQRRPPQVER